VECPEEVNLSRTDGEALIERLKGDALTAPDRRVLEADQHGYFRGLNQAWEKTLGYVRSELLARPFMNFVHPEDVTKSRAAYADVIAGRNVVHFINRYRCKDGA